MSGGLLAVALLKAGATGIFVATGFYAWLGLEATADRMRMPSDERRNAFVGMCVLFSLAALIGLAGIWMGWPK